MRVRKSKRIWFVSLGIFVAVFLFTFLVQKNRVNDEVSAASLANFDPGYIISDYQMSNYNSMSEADIQRFLTAKNPCSNRNYNYYLSLSNGSKYKWHWENDHFVCLSEERFGDGEDIGWGDSAAHIIWQAAHDYRINPQALIVLLQKETSLITDPIPNNGDYRKATGYGCPDTAPCSSQYYGFKNQVRKAAELFRTVLDGGWTNYPPDNNYIQYNPNASCGGSVVNIRSLATSALYRYTPYQPNAGALAAGYGTAACGAYGNRNFYLYFQDWFGGITDGQSGVRIPEGVYYIQAAKASNMVVDVSGGYDANGTNIQLYESNYSNAQKWKVTYNSKTDDYSIINYASGKALDVEGASVDSGANVQLWESNKTCAQRWKFVRTSYDEMKLLSSCSSKALDISNAVMANMTNLKIWDDNGNNAQKWKLLPTEVVADGLYTVSSLLDLNKVIDISGGAHYAQNGTNIQLWSKNNTSAQRWFIQRSNDGYYTVRNLQNGKGVDVAGAGTGNGANIQSWDSNNTWRILKNGDELTFISACSLKVIDVTGGNMRDGANLQLYEANNSKAQKWKISVIEKVKDGNYELVSKLPNNKVVDIFGNSSSNGANVQLWEPNKTTAQLWNITYNGKTDTYTVYNNGVKKSLDVAAGGQRNGTNVQTWNNNGTCAQKWSIVKIGDAYEFQSVCSGLVLDVSDGQAWNGANIQLFARNGSFAQRWILRTVDQ